MTRHIAALWLAAALSTCATRPAFAAPVGECVEAFAVETPCVGVCMPGAMAEQALRDAAAVDRLTRERDAARMRAAAAVDLLAAERAARVEALQDAAAESYRADAAEAARWQWAAGGGAAGAVAAALVYLAVQALVTP